MNVRETRRWNVARAVAAACALALAMGIMVAAPEQRAFATELGQAPSATEQAVRTAPAEPTADESTQQALVAAGAAQAAEQQANSAPTNRITLMAAASGTTADGWSWRISDDKQGVVLTKYAGTATKVALPADVQGLPVISAVAKPSTGAPAIESLDVSAAASTLKSLQVYGCALTSADLSACTSLTYVDLRANELAQVALPASAQRVFLSDNNLASLDVSQCAQLTNLYCASNSLAALDVSKCLELEYLDCHDNRLTGLKVGANIHLNDCFCYNNYITEDLKTLTDRYGTDTNVVLPQYTSPQAQAQAMYRLYNSYTGEHFYTSSADERDGLINVGWNDEGVGWYAPESSTVPVYRLYNPYVAGGDHHYTTSADERDSLVKVGWNDEGIGWYSDPNEAVPLYRQYNPYATTGTHNYTTSKEENDNLVKAGWQEEGIGWYGVSQS